MTELYTSICCPRCRAELGRSDGVQLQLGAAYCTRTVTLHCGRERCGGRVVWQPQSRVTTVDRTSVLEIA